MKLKKCFIKSIISIFLITTIVPTFAYAGGITGETVLSSSSPIIINPNIVNIDFNNYELQQSGSTVTVDTQFIGYMNATVGANNLSLMEDGNNQVLSIEAITANAGTFKGGMNRKDRFGIQTRLKFNNTDSRRVFGEMKSMTPTSGTAAWPNLLIFDQNGKIIDNAKKEIGSYVADQWYDILIDVDVPNRRYTVWIDGELKTQDVSLGNNYAGVLQNKLIQDKSVNGEPSRTMIASMKVGEVATPLEEIIVSDIEVDKGKAAILTYQSFPEKAYIEKMNWTSSDPSVAKVTGNGLLALETGEATITVTEQFSGFSSSFQVIVKEPTNRWSSQSISDDDLKMVLQSAHRAELEYSFEQIMTANPDIPTYMAMDEDEFIQEVKAASAQIAFPNKQTKFERYAKLFTRLYKLTDDEQYEKRAAIILYNQALDYPRIVVNHGYSDFFAGNTVFPTHSIYAYGVLLDSDIWADLDPAVSAEEVKQTIEELWFRPASYESIRAINSMSLNNIVPYGMRSSAVTAMLLNDPNMIREVIDIGDRLLNGDHYLSDSMWYEQTSSYADQVTGNVRATIGVLRNWTDPEGYHDDKLGLKMEETDLGPRWPLLELASNFGSEKLIYPNGTPIPLNDGYGVTDPQLLPIVQKGLKNIELPGLGYYSLHQGDLNDATHVGLLFQPTALGFSGGHTHTNFLSLDLWGAGAEVLPYTGYLNRTNYNDGSGATLRYPSMKPYWRNMPWIWREDGANTNSDGSWQKPLLLAYDAGTSNGKQVQLIEASAPGPEGKGAEMNRRLIMLINLGGNRNYTFDLTRMQGGQAHEIYQRGTELENMDVQVQGIQLEVTGKANLQDYLKSINSTQGLSTDREQLKNPKVGSGNSDFSFTWSGQDTGSSIRTFMNEVDGSDVFLTQIPTARRLITKADETKYVTPHLTRRNIVSDSSEITQYGAVYETFKEDQVGEVNHVEWSKPDDADPMTSITVVTSNNFEDIIYISDDMKERSFKGITFVGNVAIARTDKATGELVYSYVYGAGKVTEQNQSLIGYDSQILEITDTSISSVNLGLDPEVRENTITVKGLVLNQDLLKGRILQTKLGDGSGFGVKVKDFKEAGDSTVITLEEYTPFRITDQGAELMFWPNITIPGKAYVVFDLPKFEGDIPGQDITAPTWPVGVKLSASKVSETSLTLSWKEATDDTAVTNYKVYKNGNELVTLAGDVLSYNVSGLSSGTKYTFKVEAIDAAGNRSSDGPSINVTTESSKGEWTPEPTPKPEDGKEPVEPTDPVQPTEPETPKVELTDIGDHWAKASIEKSIKLGFVTGYEDDTFRPNAAVTRAEFATMLARALKLELGDSGLSFADKEATPAWAQPFITVIAKAGFITGYEDGTFRANKEMTRTELAVIIVRALGLKVNPDAQLDFLDADGVPAWARPFVATAAEAGLIKGNGNGKFNPNDSSTRAEAVTLILAMLNAK